MSRLLTAEEATRVIERFQFLLMIGRFLDRQTSLRRLPWHASERQLTSRSRREFNISTHMDHRSQQHFELLIAHRRLIAAVLRGQHILSDGIKEVHDDGRSRQR